MRKLNAAPKPACLACGLLEDGGRALFLARKNQLGVETVELPCVLLYAGENQVARLTEDFRIATGIDAQVHEVLFQRSHNAGSRKRKALIPALVFRMTAKNAFAKPGEKFSGFRWIASADLSKFKLARICSWLI